MESFVDSTVGLSICRSKPDQDSFRSVDALLLPLEKLISR